MIGGPQWAIRVQETIYVQTSRAFAQMFARVRRGLAKRATHCRNWCVCSCDLMLQATPRMLPPWSLWRAIECLAGSISPSGYKAVRKDILHAACTQPVAPSGEYHRCCCLLRTTTTEVMVAVTDPRRARCRTHTHCCWLCCCLYCVL